MSQQSIISVYKGFGPPFPTAVWVSIYLQSMKESVGVDDHYALLYDVINCKTHEWFFLESDIRRISAKVLEAILQNPTIAAKCGEQYLQNINHVLKLLDRRTLLGRLKKLTPKEIADLITEAAEYYRQASYYIEPPVFSLELGGHAILKQKIQEYLASQNINLPAAEFDDYFTTLINFTGRSFVQEAESSLLLIASLPKNRQDAAITDHENKFYWQLYDYYGPLLDKATIKEELAPLPALSPEDIKQRIRQIKQSTQDNEAKLNTYLKQYPLSPELGQATQAIREFAYVYSDVKKQKTSQANVGFGILLDFLAKQWGVKEPHLIHYAAIEEIINVLQGGQPLDIASLKQRSEASILSCQDPYPFYVFLSDPEAKQVRETILPDSEQIITNFKGMSANSGKYTGPARIVINASQINKVKTGDVLVAPMTTVNFVPAMKKAGAIITDIGGITSHAAIVSRELGVPCIVGLKNVTTAFKDGDMIEVNADHGTVKKI